MECFCSPQRCLMGEKVPDKPQCTCKAQERCADRPLYEWTEGHSEWTLLNMRTLQPVARTSLVGGVYWAFANIGTVSMQLITHFPTLREAQQIAAGAAGVGTETK